MNGALLWIEGGRARKLHSRMRLKVQIGVSQKRCVTFDVTAIECGFCASYSVCNRIRVH